MIAKERAEDDGLLYAARKLCQWGWGDAELQEAVDRGRLGLQELDNLSNALARYQEFWMLDLDEVSLRIHGRRAMADGDLGPATNKIILDRRCDVPDVMRAADGEVEQANIPTACRGAYPIHMDWSGYRANGGISLEEIKKAWAEAFVRWSEIVDLRYVDASSKGDAKCTVDWAPLAGSTLAWSHLATNSCGSGKQQRYDDRRWDFMLALKTMKHELGHLAGSGHLPGKNIMNPSIRDDVNDFSQYEIDHFRSLGYGPGTPRQPDPDQPDPDPDPDKPGYRVEVRTKGGLVFYADDVTYLHFLLKR